ncbi:MAG TPA: IS21 family transposase [Acidimicrobiales bacterium]|nr:IS21 family transposase [Acidimicrobiales bacterium]
MRKIREVLRLRHGEGLSIRRIGRSLGLPHMTVADCLGRAERAGLSWPLPEGMADDCLEARLYGPGRPAGASRPMPDFKAIDVELRRPHVTLALLWLEYREAHPDGYAYSQFCVLYRAYKAHLDLPMRQRHKAGEALFVDFAGTTIPIYDERTGQVSFRAELFVAVLGASNYTYAEALASQKLPHFIAAHVHAFSYFGGCPAIVVPDNLKSAVKRPDRYEADPNATYQDMANHYGIAIIPARRRHPRDKAKAEGGVLLAERWIIARLRNQRFSSIAQANEAIAKLLIWLNDRPFKKLQGSRHSVFVELEAPALRGLPEAAYELARFRKARVNIDYHVEVRDDRHFYSVPYRLVGEVVELRLTAGVVEVLHNGHRVASHLRRHRSGHTTDPAHMPESHRRHAEWTPSRILSWAARSGPNTRAIAEEILARRPHPEQGYRSCLGIIRLADRYGADRVEAACGRAAFLHAYSYRSVRSILQTGLDKVPVEKPRPVGHPRHDNLRGETEFS